MTHPTLHQMVLEHKTKSEMWATNQRSGTTLLLHHPTFFALLVIKNSKVVYFSASSYFDLCCNVIIISLWGLLRGYRLLLFVALSSL